MKVAMIGPFGLTAKSTMRERALPLARALVQRSHKVVVIVPPWDSPEDAGKSWLDEGVQVINTALPRARGPLFQLQLTALLVRTALDFQPDVIHLFKPKAYAGLAHNLLYSLKKLGRHNIKLVVDEDDWEIAWNEINPYSPLQKRFFAWQEPWGLHHADAITVASKYLRHLVRNLGVSPAKIHYLPNGLHPIKSSLSVLKARSVWQAEYARVTAGIPPQTRLTNPPQAAFFDRQLGQNDLGERIKIRYELHGHPIILLYTRFAEFELSSLMDVIRAVDMRLPEARWLILGKGYFSQEQDLELLAHQYGLGYKLTFAGWVNKEEVPYYFAAANAALHLYEDTIINRTKCSVKLLDLLANGVPVVASYVGQNAEYIKHGQTGFLAPPGQPHIVARALIDILSSYRLQQALGQNAAQDVKRRFNWPDLAQTAEKAYA